MNLLSPIGQSNRAARNQFEPEPRMNKTEANQYIEVVSGTIVGDFQVSAQLYHQGREQGPRFHADNDAQARVKAQEYVEQLKVRLGSEYRRLYPNGMELRIWD